MHAGATVHINSVDVSTGCPILHVSFGIHRSKGSRLMPSSKQLSNSGESEYGLHAKFQQKFGILKKEKKKF